MRLKAPFPTFGGKGPVASLIWSHIGDVDNAIEPFCRSAAWMLARPSEPRIETLNDVCCYVSNFWRATQRDPEAVVEHCDYPVHEADLHARHRWLVLSEAAADFVEKMRTDPDYYDPKIAGWWVWGACCWIGSGWCERPDWEGRGSALGHDRGIRVLPQKRPMGAKPQSDNHGGAGTQGAGIHAKGPQEKRPQLHTGNSEHGRGVHGEAKVPDVETKRPLLGGRSVRDNGHGVHRVPGNLPNLSGDSGAAGRGVHSSGMTSPWQQRPYLGSTEQQYGMGVHKKGSSDGSCAQRRAWLLDWFGRLRDRLRNVRVCCGDWKRVCTSPSTTTKLGVTGVFLDPPYSKKRADGTSNRSGRLYATDRRGDVDQVVADVRAYCLERGPDPLMRICLAGYAGEGHEVLCEHGWTLVEWQASGGYGNRSEVGRENAKRERLWFSPHCLKPDQSAGPLFDRPTTEEP